MGSAYSTLMDCSRMDTSVVKPFIALMCAILVSGCQTTGLLSGEHDPKAPSWSLEFAAPLYMTGWVEASAVQDVQGNLFNHGSARVIGSGDYGNQREVAKDGLTD
jgi:hypothetical protein